MTYALVAHVAAGSSDNSNVTTAAINTTGANFLIAAVGQAVDLNNGVVTDNKGNVWYCVGYSAQGANSLVRLFASIPTTVGAGHTFSFNTAGSFPAMVVGAFSGGLLNQVSGRSGTGVTSYQVGTLTAPQISGLAISVISHSDPITPTLDGGFTNVDTQPKGAANVGCTMAYLIDPTGTINPTWSWSGANTFNVGVVLTLFDKTGSAGGGGGGSFAFS